MIPSKRTEAEPEVFSITGAHVPLSKDQNARTRRYLFSMILRTVCFIGAVVASGWLRWVLIAGAVFLPYIAVVIANAGRESRRIPAQTNPMDDDARTLTS
jgi:hypothetical protein